MVQFLLGKEFSVEMNKWEKINIFFKSVENQIEINLENNGNHVIY